jgi:hypothetical protein
VQSSDCHRHVELIEFRPLHRYGEDENVVLRRLIASLELVGGEAEPQKLLEPLNRKTASPTMFDY